MFKIFIAQYCTILLLGLQSLNVRDGKYTASAITSLLLGITGWFVTGIVSQAYKSNDVLVFLSFLLAGPCGIVSSMFIYSKVFNKKGN